jgi:hypothetical protein
MTDQATLLREEIERLLADADEQQLRKVLDILRQPESLLPPLVGLKDLDAFIGQRFGMTDTHATGGLWLVLVRIDDPLIALYDELGIRRYTRDVGQPTSATAHLWRLPVDSIVACARALTPYGKDMPVRTVLSVSLTKTQETFLLAWATSFTSS